MSRGCSMSNPIYNPAGSFPSLYSWLSKQQLHCVHHQKVVIKSQKVNLQRIVRSSNQMTSADFGKTSVILFLWSCPYWLILNTIYFNYPPCNWKRERSFHSVKEWAWINITSRRIAGGANWHPNFLSGNLFMCPKSDISKGLMPFHTNIRSKLKYF